jgi:hypothetical protein
MMKKSIQVVNYENLNADEKMTFDVALQIVKNKEEFLGATVFTGTTKFLTIHMYHTTWQQLIDF